MDQTTKQRLLGKALDLYNEIDAITVADAELGGLPVGRHIGIYFESIFYSRVSPVLARRFFELGIRRVIYRYVWPRFERKAGAMNWAALEGDIAVLRAAGLKVTLVRQGVPAWATVDGTASHEIYEEGVMLLDPYGEYAADKPFAQNVTHVKPDAVAECGRQLATRLGSAIEYWGAGPNEPGMNIYNPWSYLADKGKITREQEVNYTLTEQTVPFRSGVRSVLPNAKFIGPEADSGAVLDRYLGGMKRLGIVPNVLTWHPYSWDVNGFPVADAVRRERGEFLPAAANVLGDVPAFECWLSEWGDRSKTEGHIEFAREVLTGSVTHLFIHDWQVFFANAAYEPNDYFRRMQRFIAA